VDLPGHGRSLHDDIAVPGAAKLLGAVGGQSTYVGYSMGGRIALHLAMAQPSLVKGLVLIGATAGIADRAEREERRLSDQQLAQTAVELGTDHFIDRWLGHSLFAHLSPETACRSARKTNRIEGLAGTLVHRGTGAMEPVHDRLSALAMPVLILAGEHDQKFQGIGLELQDAIGANARFEQVPGAGHACHLEAPTTTAGLINDWLGPKARR